MVVAVDVVVTSRPSGLVRLALRGVIPPSAAAWLRDKLDLLADGAGPRPVIEMVVDLSAVVSLDVRVLPVLHATHLRMKAAHGRLVVRGLDPDVLGGFAAVTAQELLAAYHASRTLARAPWPREHGWRTAAGRFTDSERRLIGFGAELVTPGPVGGATVTDRLAGWCGRVFGVQTAVVLVTGELDSCGVAVVSASDNSARLAAVTGLGAAEGPVAESLFREEPVSSSDLDLEVDRWPRYVRDARRHHVRAVRVFPLRIPSPPAPGRSATVGALILSSRRPGPMTPVDLEVALALVDLAGTALARDPRWARGVLPYPARPVSDGGDRTDLVVVQQAVGLVAERERLTLAEAHVQLADRARQRDADLGDHARAVMGAAGSEPAVAQPC